MPPVARNLIVRYPAAQLARRRGYECLKWVDLGGSIAVPGTAVTGALQPVGDVAAKVL